VITAGFGGARYLSKGKHVDLPYEHMFEHNKKIHFEGVGALAYYPNRDSLRYLDLYEVPEIKTFLRATLRYPDFCVGWQALIELGLTNQTDIFDTAGQTYASWVGRKTGYSGEVSLSRHIARLLQVNPDEKVMSMLQWLGLFDDAPLAPGMYASADVLLNLLLDKWKMEPHEKDMVVMQHEIEYLRKDTRIKLTSSMKVIGEQRDMSAMAKTVGLPMGMLARMVLNKKLDPPTGVLLPNMASVYRPLLIELAHHDIVFKEEVE
jgi:saccharopine dehydrogenase-like NADP-dependent oxidoreductase